MSAELLARKAVAELRRVRDEKVGNLRKCKPRFATITKEGGVIGAATVEEIALYAVDTNATVDALNMAIDIIEVEFNKITRPEEPEDTADESKPKQARTFYGN